MIDIGGRITVYEISLTGHGSVHMTVKDQAAAAAGPQQRSHHIESVAEEADPSGNKSFSLQPLIEVFVGRQHLSDRMS